ncbi:MAG: acyl-CoA desaturase [Oceanidesulfovibrio sp.]
MRSMTRYFCHRAYSVSRPMQFFLAFLGTSAAQRGPLWWAAHHMRHHRNPDAEGDVHSPVLRGFLWAHVGWTFVPENASTDMKSMKGWAKYPELRLLNRFHQIAPAAWAAGCYGLGWWLGSSYPHLGTSGPQMLIWGFFIPTVVLYHATFCVNSVCHMWGLRRYETNDQSRNNPLVALATLGEGWHNNHHRFPISARQGVGFWEFDPTYWILRGLAALGLVSNIRERPAATRE